MGINITVIGISDFQQKKKSNVGSVTSYQLWTTGQYGMDYLRFQKSVVDQQALAEGDEEDAHCDHSSDVEGVQKNFGLL